MLGRSKTTPHTKATVKILGYGMPRSERDTASRVHSFDDFELHDEPLRSSVSFLHFDGVVVFAGTFERLEQNFGSILSNCIAPADLDHRERELVTIVQQQKPVVFFVPRLHIDYHSIGTHNDLFRRIAAKFGLGLSASTHATPFVQSLVTEFEDYVSRFGTGYVALNIPDNYKEDFVPLLTCDDEVFGLVWANKLFILPSVIPQRVEQIPEIVGTAIRAAFAYRHRMSQTLPEWVSSFAFSKEAELRDKATRLHLEATQLEVEVDAYSTFKGALCLQSDPLVESVRKLLQHFFGIKLDVDDKCIEDATLREDDEIKAVFEIKGIKGNFTRNHVNQVDSHRERLNIPPATPGVLIINTMMSAESLADKDERPHPDIVRKAVADNVLLARTLDLLRYADAIERGVLTPESFRTTILTDAGWLQVKGDSAVVHKE